MVNLTFFPKDLRTILTHLSRQAFTHFFNSPLGKKDGLVRQGFRKGHDDDEDKYDDDDIEYYNDIMMSHH